MIVVSDTSALSALFLVHRLDLLPALYGQVIAPPAVMTELEKLQLDFGHDLSDIRAAAWLKIVVPADRTRYLYYRRVLDEGESEALTLMHELPADLLLIDEIQGRKIAQAEGLAITGILGVLLSAKSRKIIAEVRPIIDDLRTIAGFHLSQAVYDAVLKQAQEWER